MATTVIDEYVLPVLVRYIDRYGWGWSISRRIINRYYGTEYTLNQLKRLYRQNK